MDQARFDAIRLARSPRIGPVTFRQLMARFGGPTQALIALPDLAHRGGRPIALANERAIAAEVEAAARLGAEWVICGDANYPALLAETEDAPPVLTYRGDLSLAGHNCIAMVGARNASAAACRFARALARELAGEDMVVVSGLARGIDTAAHQGAEVRTIGVIAGGIDISYPPENAALQEKIASAALLIAEQPPGTEPKARYFPHRNRIIAGLSRATVVVEAAPKSGSLITARMAGDYGREVLAVPGSPLDPRAQGCNLLIREGATLIQSAADVLEALGPLDPRMGRRRVAAQHDLPLPESVTGQGDVADIITLLGPVPVLVDELIRQSGQPSSAVQMALLELELAGRLERHAGGRVALIA
ncbi:MAG: DNA-processing protein DprA [Sphingobium sp.]|nr:DNA-processing protein DprA [Sphingobium sp.]MBP6112508.1 DNA-processing protein DprA [Sphingobium sp.]MBP8669937.1 DNA-processing protein DprA [Sphingobium sp.]MBP9157868.1 DNA-processing protein DprA [Sphingobium sp.]